MFGDSILTILIYENHLAAGALPLNPLGVYVPLAKNHTPAPLVKINVYVILNGTPGLHMAVWLYIGLSPWARAFIAACTPALSLTHSAATV